MIAALQSPAMRRFELSCPNLSRCSCTSRGRRRQVDSSHSRTTLLPVASPVAYRTQHIQAFATKGPRSMSHKSPTKSQYHGIVAQEDLYPILRFCALQSPSLGTGPAFGRSGLPTRLEPRRPDATPSHHLRRFGETLEFGPYCIRK
jgi:hypothetical protein